MVDFLGYRWSRTFKWIRLGPAWFYYRDMVEKTTRNYSWEDYDDTVYWEEIATSSQKNQPLYLNQDKLWWNVIFLWWIQSGTWLKSDIVGSKIIAAFNWILCPCIYSRQILLIHPFKVWHVFVDWCSSICTSKIICYIRPLVVTVLLLQGQVQSQDHFTIFILLFGYSIMLAPNHFQDRRYTALKEGHAEAERPVDNRTLHVRTGTENVTSLFACNLFNRELDFLFYCGFVP